MRVRETALTLTMIAYDAYMPHSSWSSSLRPGRTRGFLPPCAMKVPRTFHRGRAVPRVPVQPNYMQLSKGNV